MVQTKLFSDLYLNFQTITAFFLVAISTVSSNCTCIETNVPHFLKLINLIPSWELVLIVIVTKSEAVLHHSNLFRDDALV